MILTDFLQEFYMGLLMKNYDVKKSDEIKKITNSRFVILSFAESLSFLIIQPYQCFTFWKLFHIL